MVMSHDDDDVPFNNYDFDKCDECIIQMRVKQCEYTINTFI